MAFDELPIDRFREQAVDVFIFGFSVGLVEHQLLNAADAGHEADTQQVRQAEHRGTLGLCVAMDRVRLDVRFVLDQTVKDIDRLMYTAGNEVAKKCDVLTLPPRNVSLAV